jgi:hypothetical protein
MPRIIVTSDGPTDRVLHSERVSPEDFETAHFRHQLAERVAWAVADADGVDDDVRDEAPRFKRRQPSAARS